MYDKILARRVRKLITRRILELTQCDDITDVNVQATNLLSLLDMFYDIIKLNDIETINISIKEVKR